MEEELSPQDAAALDALMADVERELVRVDVDWQATASAILADLRGHDAALDARIAEADAAPEDDDGWEPVLGLDATGLLAVLRPLSDGAGTAAFVAAYRAQAGRPDAP